MFTKLLTETTKTDKIWCIPFEYAPLECQNSISSIDYGRSITLEDTFVIYTIYQNKPYLLGYCICSDRNMSTSCQYNALRENTININGYDINDEIPNKKCICIEKWVFDESLKNRNSLYQIFSVLARTFQEQEPIIMWCEGENELIFYPINDNELYWAYPHVTHYFTNAFLNL